LPDFTFPRRLPTMTVPEAIGHAALIDTAPPFVVFVGSSTGPLGP
jgi:hypothetical protein